jgi:transglutaminase-like putative cysteine protease
VSAAPADQARSSTVAAELALLALTLATVAGFGRLFTDRSYFLPLAVIGVVTHLVAAACRRRDLGVPVSAVLTALALVPVLTLLFFASESLLGLPTPAVVEAARAALDDAWLLFQDVVAPAPPVDGFLMTAGVAVAAAAFLADWAGFRLWSPLEAVVPPATLFVFASMLGADRARVMAAALFGTATLLFLLLHRAARLAATGSWVNRAVDRGTSAVVRAGAALVAVALVVGIAVGPAVPGAEEPGIIRWRASDRGPGSRVTISPLVDIRTRLVRQADTEVFTVEADEAQYWRLTALDEFDGQIWRSSGKFSSADGELPTGPPSVADRDTLTQSIVISNLAALWLPAAYEPRSIDSPDVDVRFQPESGTLIVDTDVENSDDMGYVVESAVPSFTPEELSGADQDAMEAALRDHYTDLDGDLSELAAAEAERITAGATTDYERVLALQRWFRDPAEFTYNLDAPSGHGLSAIDAFLESRIGYCEQFAGTFAAMARHLGIPARVAVGFTWGDYDDATGVFRVRGEHAHAWPEVWFEGFGWVPFEPTPDRGAPGAEPWTAVPPEQAGDAVGTSTTVSTVVAPSTSIGTGITEPPPRFGDELRAGTDDSTGGSGGGGGGLHPALLVAAAVVAVVLLYAGGVLLLLAMRRNRRRAAATSAGQRVLVAWDEALEALSALGVARRSSETYLEFADHTGQRFPAHSSSLRVLARDASAADYAPGTVTEDSAQRAGEAARSVEEGVEGRLGPRRLLLWRLDVRRLLRRRDSQPTVGRWSPGTRARLPKPA